MSRNLNKKLPDKIQKKSMNSYLFFKTFLGIFLSISSICEAENPIFHQQNTSDALSVLNQNISKKEADEKQNQIFSFLISQNNNSALRKRRTKELKSAIQKQWPKMRVNLALSAPAIREDRILPDSSTWLDSTPSHLISDFSDLPRLTDEERSKAQKIYVEILAKTPLEKFSSAEFKQRMYRGKPLSLPLSGEKHLTSKDKFKLKKTVRDLQKEAKDSYFKILSEMPVLGYLKTRNPKKEELDKAFAKMEEKLKDFLKETKEPEVDEGLLLSFKPLVEELLKEDKEYCLVAEKARVKAEKDESLKNWMLLGAGVVAAVPCLITGVAGASACLLAGTALGIVGYKEVQVATKQSLGRALTRKQFETIAGLKDKEKEEFLAKLYPWEPGGQQLYRPGRLLELLHEPLREPEQQQIRNLQISAGF